MDLLVWAIGLFTSGVSNASVWFLSLCSAVSADGMGIILGLFAASVVTGLIVKPIRGSGLSGSSDTAKKTKEEE